MSKFDSVDLDDQTVFGAQIANGMYDAKIINVEGSITKAKQVPMLTVTFEITAGDLKGLTHQKRYFLTAKIDKNGKPYSFGVARCDGAGAPEQAA
jgi:hypothetical protein